MKTTTMFSIVIHNRLRYFVKFFFLQIVANCDEITIVYNVYYCQTDKYEHNYILKSFQKMLTTSNITVNEASSNFK